MPSIRPGRVIELMGYDQVDAVGEFAPMVNPLRGTRGVQGKGRKSHTTVDVDELVRCLQGNDSLQVCRRLHLCFSVCILRPFSTGSNRCLRQSGSRCCWLSVRQ